MKERVKGIMNRLGVYHPAQLGYRRGLFLIKRFYFRLKYRAYKGTGYTCNICGSSYRRFAPDRPTARNREAIRANEVIAGYGENILCPNCLSTARDRLVIAMLTDMHVEGKKVLHLSPEKNVFRYLTGRASVTTADLMPGYYKDVDRNINKNDLQNLSYADDSFDLVIGNHILEHIPDDHKAMKEVCRVLKKDGTAILQVPFSRKLDATFENRSINDPIKQSILFGQKDHVRIYGLNDYLSRLADAGFKVDYIPHELLTKFYRFAIQPGEGFFKIRK